MAGWFNTAKHRLLNYDLDLRGLTASADIDVMLMLDSYTFDPDHDFVSDVNAGEAAGTTRQNLTGVTITLDDTNNRAFLDATDVTFSAVAAQATGTLINAVICFENIGGDSVDIPTTYNDFSGGGIAGNGSDITVTWSDVSGATGVLDLL